MKRSFLLTVILGALVTAQVYGQTKKVTTTTSTTTQAAEAEKSAFDKFYERLGISYFGAYTSPTLEDWDTTNAAISPEYGEQVGECHNCDSYSQNIFNQFNFSYNYGGMFKFHIVPRFTLFLSEPKDNGTGDQALVTLEDTLVAFSGTIFTSEDKKFSWWMRPGVRLPTSHASRTSNNAAFGRTTYVLDWNNTFTWTPTKDLEIGYALVNRVWIFEERYNLSRHRIISNPWISYSLTDTAKLQMWYEHFLENNKNWESINGKEPQYEDVWQNLMLGVAYDVTPKLNVMPFISAFINDVPFSAESFWLGAWVSYSIK